MHNILPCNLKLHFWGILASPTYTFYNQMETVEHILFQCADVTNVWKKLLPVFHMSNLSIFEMVFGCGDLHIKWTVSLIQQKIFTRCILCHNQKKVTELEYFLYQELQYKLCLYGKNNFYQFVKH